MRTFVLLSFIIILLTNCANKKAGEVHIMDNTLKQNIATVSNARIFFAHQSVGYNILDGLSKINKEAGANLNIIEINRSTKLPFSYFAHMQIGQNTKPLTKCDAFYDVLQRPFADSLDIACLKFCYVDINKDTDVEAMFEYYKKTIEEIKEKHPDLKIVHITVPLHTIQSGWKAVIKKLLGKPLGNILENVKRNEYNQRLKQTFKNEPIFDLARVESTYPDGSRNTFEYNGKKYFALIPDYSIDGGHLNTLGSQLAAKEMMRVLADVVKNEK